MNEQQSAMLDYLAREAMKSLLASPAPLPIWQVPKKSYELAASMLEERKQMLEHFAKKEECKTLLYDWMIKDGLLTIRSLNCLRAEGIEYAEELVKCTERQLLKFPNLGRKSINEIKEAMRIKGFSLKEPT